MPASQFTVIGLGWLGLSFAETLLERNLSVFGTVRSAAKANSLAAALSTKVIEFDCYEGFKHSHREAFFNDRVVVINIAAGRRQIDSDTYSNAIIDLIKTIFDNDARKLIFVSSTSVFGALTGKITNQTLPSPVTQSAMAHTAIEQFILDNYGHKSCILRLAGLVGSTASNDYRHPIYSLTARGIINAANQPVNLIHKWDVIEAIIAAATNDDVHSRAFNLCSAHHPTKLEYYGWCAKQLNLKTPEFVISENAGRYVDASETIALLGLKLKYSDPRQMLP